jgi:hypothetical protein
MMQPELLERIAKIREELSSMQRLLGNKAQQRYWTDLWDTLLELEMSNERNGSQCREPTMKSK